MGVSSEAPGEKSIWSRLGLSGLFERGGLSLEESQDLSVTSLGPGNWLSIMRAKAIYFSLVSFPMDRPLPFCSVPCKWIQVTMQGLRRACPVMVAASPSDTTTTSL